jgi:hypothetical protein
VIKPLVHAL